MSKETPTVVLVHGAFADGSSWNGVIKRLHAKGVKVTAPANPLRGISIDSAYTASVFAQTPGPVLAVGHSYGGAVITNAASEAANVVGLVYVAEVEDSVAGQVEGLEGRFGRKHLDSRDLGVSLFRYAPNLRSPMAHSHREQEEADVVVAGSGRILLDDQTQELRIWDAIRVAPEVVRAFEAGPDGLDIIAVGGPKPEEGDGVRAAAIWPDRISRAARGPGVNSAPAA